MNVAGQSRSCHASLSRNGSGHRPVLVDVEAKGDSSTITCQGARGRIFRVWRREAVQLESSSFGRGASITFRATSSGLAIT
jgi:hypothetical protein